MTNAHADRRIARGAARRICASMLGLVALGAHDLRAETLKGALAFAYASNPDLEEQRAIARIRDEDVSKAAAGHRPKAGVSFSAGPQKSSVRQPGGRDQLRNRLYTNDDNFGYPRSGTLNLSLTVFDGWRSDNSMRQAESGVLAARATLMAAEQEVLLRGVTVYMDVLRDTATLGLRRHNQAVLAEQLRVARDRADTGMATVADVAQAEAALAQAASDHAGAREALRASVAEYREVIGRPPNRLEPAQGCDPDLPATIERAVERAIVAHPQVISSLHHVDMATMAVKVAEGALMPSFSVGGQVYQQYDSYLGYPGTKQFSAQVTGTLNVPLYDGGAEYSAVRQAKQQLGQAQVHVTAQRSAIRAKLAVSYSRLAATKAAMHYGGILVRSSETALAQIRNEAEFGQRTLLDVLNAQQALFDARVKMVSAQHDRVVASCSALAAIGGLSADGLSLDVERYDPAKNLERVRDLWIGVDMPEDR
ncbi:TolC family outer membrane protein [Methylosinus sp. H3A]|uniref:TolC family outer membrane protein n=1 Tax=Methylosinus sp. H3A TaxID=2785786 RepID=UPI0018C1ED93|nr:TolC family outer membrane protein [Methylosinus sp. H3A]MBG0807968.1 TolC family outer membrane protein [Methylosinus sp. H3A]